jgi:hypothetical protein
MSPLSLKAYFLCNERKLMKKRVRQRANRKIKEKMLDIKNIYGVNDPTPHEAVKEIVKEFKKKQCQM